MTVYIFTKTFPCPDTTLIHTCHATLENQAKAAYPVYQSGVNGHLNATHGPGGVHNIEFALYTSGNHEYLDWNNMVPMVLNSVPKTAYAAIMPADPNKPF